MSDLYHTALVTLVALHVTLRGTLNNVLANANILRCPSVLVSETAHVEKK
jgi:hypothetical protein